MNSLNPAQKQWTIEQVAQQLQVDISTVRRWTRRRTNRLKVLRFGYRTVRVPDSELARFLGNQAV